MAGPLMRIGNARFPEQQKQMEDITREGICPFCDEHLGRTHREPIEWQGAWWSITKNDYPYEGASIHYLLIARQHISRLDEVHPEAWIEFGMHLARLSQMATGGGVVMRWGDMSMNSASVSHLHAHFIVGGPPKEGGEKIKVSVGNKI